MSHRRFRNRGTEYVSDYGMKWMSGSTKQPPDDVVVDGYVLAVVFREELRLHSEKDVRLSFVNSMIPH
jgi:hypothetical protein